MRTGVALGSNLGDRLANLRTTRKAILQLAGVTPPILASAIYETEPIDCESGAGKFLNAVLEFDYEGDPLELLKKLGELERALGRLPNHSRNLSRKIDIDLLYFGATKIDKKELQLPHPRMHLRRFVLQPLADIRPDLVLPNQTKTVRELLAQFDESGKVVRHSSDWEAQ
ncbi:MAG: 2-amino-4-hydroxy-6-hydroxymethyldihydropteridine diphosphokinase [Verrucomicrobia bacterium]|nr:MAG: 2-amino-4-hydroxy-6-hydroxymethyldihydropteridine diphosphokinase [Verrucomicrobiota bacterium]